ncbi:MAG: LytR/AlgR family response regulator transcription factor [Lewinella sp.]|uniref:LytR/AlgR family response regulator transcription factor n=1 Tax=Lewinella sp. TaxID=2004506 RepID=UPI003D6A46A0
MKVLIIEDEYRAVQYLQGLLNNLITDLEILGTLDSIEASVQWLQQNPSPELIFMDIQLADGLSFDIFKHVNISAPIIFTTAFDQYTLRAFKMNSIDYLLKPIEEEELQAALNKYGQYYQPQVTQWQELIANLQINQGDAYRQRFLTKQGKSLGYLLVKDIAYLYSDEGITFAIDKQGKRFVIDSTIDRLQGELAPQEFFRINRGQIVHLQAIRQIHSWFSHRLKIDLHPSLGEQENIVSRDRVKAFKAWLDQ